MADKKKTMYIETTIPSYATARSSNDLIKAARQELTKMFWENNRKNYDLFISRFVIDECANGDKDAAKSGNGRIPHGNRCHLQNGLCIKLELCPSWF